ncbi:MAG TPA: hypothetical protein VFS55_07070 [Dokdonella sp.]|nr:hypothetical protein [Dokdonella sp.]
MHHFYPAAQANSLLNELAGNAALRTQLLQNPRDTLSTFGFDISADVPLAQRAVARESDLAESAKLASRCSNAERQQTLAIAVLILK